MRKRLFALLLALLLVFSLACCAAENSDAAKTAPPATGHMKPETAAKTT